LIIEEGASSPLLTTKSVQICIILSLVSIIIPVKFLLGLVQKGTEMGNERCQHSQMNAAAREEKWVDYFVQNVQNDNESS